MSKIKSQLETKILKIYITLKSQNIPGKLFISFLSKREITHFDFLNTEFFSFLKKQFANNFTQGGDAWVDMY